MRQHIEDLATLTSSVELMSHPASSKSSMILTFPRETANISGVWPFYDLENRLRFDNLTERNKKEKKKRGDS